MCEFVSLHVFHWSSCVWSEMQTSSPLDEFVRKEALIRMPSIDFLQVQSGALSASNQWLDTTLHFIVANKAVRLFVHPCKDLRKCEGRQRTLQSFFVLFCLVMVNTEVTNSLCKSVSVLCRLARYFSILGDESHLLSFMLLKHVTPPA